MMNEEWDELLRQQDEETSFADKYSEELEMMNEIEADPSPPISSSRKSLSQLKCYAEDYKDAIDESPLPPVPPNSLCDSSYEASYITNGGMKHQEEHTPQRRVTCTPKSMGEEMGVVASRHEDSGNHRPNMNHVTTIAGLLHSHAVAMETDSFEEQQQDDSIGLCDESLSSASQPMKRASSEDMNYDSILPTDEVSNRPFKRRRKLIATDSQEQNDAKEETSVIETSNDSREKDKDSEQITTPVDNVKSQVVKDTSISGSTKNKPFFTSTPNDITYSNNIDSSLEEDTIVPSTRYQYTRQRVLRRVPAGAHMTVTGSDGTRVYLRLSSEHKKHDTHQRPRKYQLLSVPFYQLRYEVESKKRKKLLEKSKEAISSLKSLSRGDRIQRSTDSGEVVAEKEAKRQLWVDQYSPHHFTELLSDDGTNRTLLAWLKLWDGVVFGRSAVRETVKKKKEEETKKGGTKKPWVEYKDPETFSTVDALDTTNRPKLKLALLCGPPGLGKTTMAHVVARHAGYNVVEMNASDDRSPEVFQRSIEAATQMQALSVVDSRPNCLIIDEIDGAPTAAINVLLDVIKNKASQGKKPQKNRPQILSRPIICICNDQYATSLRQLRQNSLVLTFPPTSHSRLASRLIEICRREQLQTSISTLMALCEKTDADIRSCLNTLQFIRQNYKELSITAINNTAIGQKDAQKSLFSLWKQVFHLPSSKSKKVLSHIPKRRTNEHINEEQYPADPVTSNAEATQNLSTSAIRFHTILSAAQTTGEDEKSTQGLFENYLEIKFKDPNLEAVSVAQDWMEFKDTLQRHVNVNQDYSIAPYHHFLCVAYHFLFAAPSLPKIHYPHKDFEVRQAMQKNSQLIDAVLVDVPAKVKCFLNSRTAVTELLPPLLEIISPNLRPVNTQLYSSKEKRQLSDLINTMIACNLTYKQEKVPDGQYVYTLEPNVDEVIRFSGQAQRRQLTYATKQLIGREIEMEKVRRAEASVYKSDSREPSTPPKSGGGSISNQKKTPTVVKRPTQIEPKPLPKNRSEPALARDFFGRIIKPKASRGFDGATQSQKKTGHILWFKYNEGYSNAVRRPIKMKDLL